MTTILTETSGYIIIAGLGFVLSILVTALTSLERKYLGYDNSAEAFTSASRSVKTGLMTASIVSANTWVATLLQSCTVVYLYGISGAFWYGASVVATWLILAVFFFEAKKRAPNCHTYAEIIKARYGIFAHVVFMFFSWVELLLASSLLIISGSAVVSQLTGVNTYASCILIPAGVLLYTFHGGLRSTFVADYIHCTFIFILILTIGLSTYAFSDLIGSPSAMYKLLTEAGNAHPVPSNAGGSYLTMSSIDGLIFGIQCFVASIAVTVVDQGTWQRTIASRAETVTKSIILGSLVWFIVPFFLATTLGLACIALESNPSFPSFPLRLSPDQINQGLVAPFAAVTLLGEGGAWLMLIMILLAVTSSFSAICTGFSSLLTYDLIRTYLNKSASGDDIIKYSMYSILGFGTFSGLLACLLNYLNANLGYLFGLFGILISSPTFPIIFSVMWSKQSVYGAISGVFLGLACGLTAWLCYAEAKYGNITMESTGDGVVQTVAAVVSIFSSLIITVVVSLLRPDNFNFNVFKMNLSLSSKSINDLKRDVQGDDESVDLETKLKQRALSQKLFGWLSLILSFLLLVVWPVPLIASSYVFSESFFIGWIIFSFLWAFSATIFVTLYPIIESRASLYKITRDLTSDILTGNIFRNKGNSNVNKSYKSDTIKNIDQVNEIKALSTAFPSMNSTAAI